MALRLSLHPNTLRPHLRRLEEAGLVASETEPGTTVGRPQTLYTVVERDGPEGRDYRLLADILAGLLTGRRARDRAQAQAREWGAFLAGRTLPRPGARRARRAATSRCCRRRWPRPDSTPGSGAGARGAWRSACATARSGTCWTSTANWSAPSTRGSWRASWRPRGRP